MKTTVSVNLGGLAFYLDEDAYATLQQYLARVERSYSQEDGCEEILADIEARVADLFRERVIHHKQVVVLADVMEVMRVMGEPADFEDEKSDARTSLMHTRHNRIYRDVDNAMIGGVCSGLAAYWSIDIIIMRILFVAFAIMGGVSFIVYPILWMVLPAAYTTTQKIEMKGKPVTVNNIKDTVITEFNKVRDNLKKK